MISPTPREPGLLGQTVVMIGGRAAIGLETADEHALREPTSSSPPAIPSATCTPRSSSAR